MPVLDRSLLILSRRREDHVVQGRLENKRWFIQGGHDNIGIGATVIILLPI